MGNCLSTTTAAGSRERLQRLIDGGLVRPVVQPIVDLQHGQIAGFESLSRPAEESGFANAGELFDVAESMGMLWDLERVTRRLSAQAAAQWPLGVLLFLNCSPQVFSDPRFADALLADLAELEGLDPNRIVLELTERSEQQYSPGLAEQVRLAKERGFQVAIDDVGAGTSGLNRIMSLRPHWLKLDRGLVDRIDEDRVRQNMIRFFVHFSRVSGVRVVAEGIERREELATLIELGVSYGQGYCLGRPGSRDQMLDPALAAWLRRTWQDVEDGQPAAMTSDYVGRLARPVPAVQCTAATAIVAEALESQSAAPGVVVLEGRRFVGWCDRKAVLRAQSKGQAERPVGLIVSSRAPTIRANASIAEALDLLAARDDKGIAEPLVIRSTDGVQGIVTLRDLLHAAAELMAAGAARAAVVDLAA
jgi:EAL domain-containing protein (putative c-di-GMP-specific phosphodiesterase class I)/CBS domain-containing protein